MSLRSGFCQAYGVNLFNHLCYNVMRRLFKCWVVGLSQSYCCYVVVLVVIFWLRLGLPYGFFYVLILEICMRGFRERWTVDCCKSYRRPKIFTRRLFTFQQASVTRLSGSAGDQKRSWTLHTSCSIVATWHTITSCLKMTYSPCKGEFYAVFLRVVRPQYSCTAVNSANLDYNGRATYWKS